MAQSDKELNLKIGGMHCAGCAAGIEKGLTALEGVSEARVNFALGTASVSYDNEQVSEKRIFDKISELGYSSDINSDHSSALDAELSTHRRDFFTALILALPVFILSISDMFLGRPLLPPHLAGAVALVLTIPILFYAGRNIFRDALNQTIHFRANMNSLIALGTLAAFVYSLVMVVNVWRFDQAGPHYLYFDTAAIIITLILLGRFLESRARFRAGSAISALMKLRPEKALAFVDGEEIEIDTTAIRPGMIITVRPGERIPADGIVVEGTPAVDESMLTGESMPVEKAPEEPVIGGSLNSGRTFKFRVTGAGSDTFLSHVIRLVAEAQNRKAPVQRLADRIAGIFVPVILTIAVVTLGLWYLLSPDSPMLFKAPVAVLIIACPCALGLATPTAILAGTGRAARRGIYIRGGDVLEKATRTDLVVFDKTGTLTEGRFGVVKVMPVDEARDEQLLQLAASVEAGSGHPLAEAIREKARQYGLNLIPARDTTENPGFGLKATVDDTEVVIGNEATMKKQRIDIEPLETSAEEEMALGRTVVYVAADGRFLGFISLADKVKEEAPQVIEKIRDSGREMVMLTGDNYKTARGVASVLGISRFEAQVKPDQKATIVETLRRADKNVMMVGDGINDAPALAAANVGVALGSGMDVALETADIILVKDNLESLLDMLDISRLTYKIIKQNLFWAFFYNISAVPIAAGLLYPLIGWGLSPIIAALAMSFSSLFVVLNSLRLLRAK